METNLETVKRRLKQGQPVADVHWDAILAPQYQPHSPQHFTPVEVALRAAQLLSNGKPAKILDVGSGLGKFCLVGALATEAHFTGVERRRALVSEANRLKELLGAERAHFIHGEAMELDWNAFDAFYLFNPFLEHLISQIRLDESVSFSEPEFEKNFRGVQAHLRRAPLGTRVALYHGMGGGIPVGYRRLLKENAGTGFLELWEKKENV